MSRVFNKYGPLLFAVLVCNASLKVAWSTTSSVCFGRTLHVRSEFAAAARSDERTMYSYGRRNAVLAGGGRGTRDCLRGRLAARRERCVALVPAPSESRRRSLFRPPPNRRLERPNALHCAHLSAVCVDLCCVCVCQ